MGKIGELREVDINLLKPYENNAKIHGEEQIELLMRSISEFGFLSPCLVERDTYNLIAGHGRVEAAKRLGLDAVPCVFVDDLTEEQRRAYILADNRLTELGEWDMDIVQYELKALDDLDFDVSVTGFDFDLNIDSGSFEEPKYTSVVDIPQYQPGEEPVELWECFDDERYREMLEEIDGSGLPEDEKEFLRLAASRHIVFSYKKIADYYARASKRMQELMERSALVIIDVEDAIKWGFARLSSYLDEIEEREKGE